MDDLVDGDVDRGAEGMVAMLAGVFYHHVIRRYTGLLGDDSRFWDRFEAVMTQWRESTLDRGEPVVADLRQLEESALLALAERGALLKIGCVAACLLSGREEAMPALLSAMDHWLVSKVRVVAADLDQRARGCKAGTRRATHIKKAPASGTSAAIRKARL